MTLLKVDTWIKAGYDLLGREGVEGIKIERLARILHLNKSGFYYYFNTMDGFLRSVLEYHIRMAREVAAQLSACKSVDPDVLLVIVRFKSFFLVESQLLSRNRNVPLHLDVDVAGRIISDELIRLWQRTGEIRYDTSTVLAYLNIIRHFFYVRITAEEIDYEFLRSIAAETRDVLEKVSSDRHLH
ncbi:MAG TPA: TetR family transcriptional regulator [Chryseolinea sp.]|nr:TetR family transcriptional regulator [Chryseolinea sp.]